MSSICAATSVPSRGIPARNSAVVADETRRALWLLLRNGYAKDICVLLGRNPPKASDLRYVRDRIEGHAALTIDIFLGGLALIPRHERVRILRHTLGGCLLAVAALPDGAGLRPSPATALASALPSLARAAEGAALSQIDGQITPDEVAAVRREVNDAVTLASDGLATMEVACGERLLG